MSRNPLSAEKRKKFLFGSVALVVCLLIGLGVLAKNNMLPHTDRLTGKKTGWFGKELPKNASSSWNPFAPPLPAPTPQLAREFLYAGQKLLAQVDSEAQESPPADLAIWRPSTGDWWIMNGAANGNYSSYSAATWGNGSDPDKTVPGDYDGDGKTDFAVFRPSTNTWWIAKSSDSSFYGVPYGATGDIPAQADYDGDGKTDVAVFRPSTNYWYINQSSTGATAYVSFGATGDVPAPADFDGDGKADVAVWRNSDTTFYSSNSSNANLASHSFGLSSSEPVPGDYDGDGKADYAIRQSGSNNWLIRKSSTGTTDTISWQNSGDIAVHNDYDGDGKVDIAVWRDSNGTWYIRPSTNPASPRTQQWGASGDIPVPAFYRR